MSAAVSMQSIMAKAGEFESKGQWSAAENALLEALTLQPKNVHVMARLGNVYLHQEKFADAENVYRRSTELKHGLDQPAEAPETLSFSLCKLQHDYEQLQYLVKKGRLPETFKDEVAVCEKILRKLEKTMEVDKVVSMPPDLFEFVKSFYNKLVHVYYPPAMREPALNDRDFTKVEKEYKSQKFGIVYVDDFLTDKALSELRRLCLESTIWFDVKSSYLGTYMRDGFACGLLFQIARELKQKFSGVIADHKLKELWAYKYDSRKQGIGLHADPAAVNVNFWITPDSACIDKAHGGLQVYDVKPPSDWNYIEYNRRSAKIREFLDSVNAKPVVVPHRQNRAVIFDSKLFHETDNFHFAEGYENRRINITLLYGNQVT